MMYNTIVNSAKNIASRVLPSFYGGNSAELQKYNPNRGYSNHEGLPCDTLDSTLLNPEFKADEKDETMRDYDTAEDDAI